MASATETIPEERNLEALEESWQFLENEIQNFLQICKELESGLEIAPEKEKQQRLEGDNSTNGDSPSSNGSSNSTTITLVTSSSSSSRKDKPKPPLRPKPKLTITTSSSVATPQSPVLVTSSPRQESPQKTLLQTPL